MAPKGRGKLGARRCDSHAKRPSGIAPASRKGVFPVKTAITIIADLVRSLVISGIATAGLLLLIVAGAASTGYGLWRLWRRSRR